MTGPPGIGGSAAPFGSSATIAPSGACPATTAIPDVVVVSSGGCGPVVGSLVGEQPAAPTTARAATQIKLPDLLVSRHESSRCNITNDRTLPPPVAKQELAPFKRWRQSRRPMPRICGRARWRLAGAYDELPVKVGPPCRSAKLPTMISKRRNPEVLLSMRQAVVWAVRSHNGSRSSWIVVCRKQDAMSS